MKALVTGASSGIGRDIAIYLSKLGYDLIVVARREDRLIELKNLVKTNVKIICQDLSIIENVKSLYTQIKDENIDVLINNAGFGLYGQFTETDLEKEIELINTNDIAVHILMKLVLNDMTLRNSGYILNVPSIAGFVPGPLMATYYASKAYVIRLAQSVDKELRKKGSDVHLSVLCPGPVRTEFNEVAKAGFSAKPMESSVVAKYAIDMMLKNKLIITPGFFPKLIRVLSKILPSNILGNMVYGIQKRKINKTRQKK
jgi:short-subunit dehydrogenase